MRPHGYNDFTFQSGFILIEILQKQMIEKWDFTFQSGFILIVNGTKKGHCSLRLYIPIWFYSNAQIEKAFGKDVLPLHSNMVLF